MDGFVRLVHDLPGEAGIESSMVFCSTRSGEDDQGEQPKPSTRKPIKGDGPRCTQTQLPGWFRAEKGWDLLVVGLAFAILLRRWSRGRPRLLKCIPRRRIRLSR